MAITAIRTILIYALLTVSMRIMGRRQLGELQPIELVVTLLIAELAAIPMQDSGIPLLTGMIPIFVLVSVEILLSAWMLKSPRFASLVSGTPILLIHNGKLDQAALKKLRMTVEDLMESLRKEQIFDLRDVQSAIAETSGNITVYPVAAKRPAVYGDVARSPIVNHGMPLVVMADGEPCDWAMQACGVTEQWIDSVLQQQGYQRHEVMVLLVNGIKEYHIIPREIKT